ncbi:hypothetical protein SVEN_3014 [Streptomyces venezuelae ATCC 10712]|uniref:Uncharacterized protein n=2 Tax=Streptomyces TaxID=1883 RepID=F2R7L5_STRVP|nr:hypothetical protein vnz_14820 [Streptomyces venezuelae]CCA56300.1 hypothetical protein SVEN_3014 [Streptomyces venezuelae ATCC 10712]
MREQAEHTRTAESGPTVEVDLRALLKIVTPIEEHAEDLALRAVRRALTMEQNPDALELARLTDKLLTHCASLAVGIETIPVKERPARGQGALRDWATLQKDGPGDGPLGTWSYARQLALVARSMVKALRSHRASTETRAPYVGRPGLPPLAPSAP